MNAAMKKPLIIVLGANPSWQKTLHFSKLDQGKVNRARYEMNYPSGKGVNFCRALRCSDLADMRLFQFAGGINGKQLCDALDEINFPHTTIASSPTRCCITCLDECGNMTELIGVSLPLKPQESSAMLTALTAALPQAAMLAITGSLPDGSDPELYIKTARAAAANDVPLLIDSLAAIDEILSIPGKMILKVNKEEFFKIIGESEIIAAHHSAAAKFPDKIFAVTDGADMATLSDGKSLTVYSLPVIDVTSPLGAGDTASAIMSALYALGENPQQAFLHALAAASANCLNATAGEYSPAEAQRLAALIKMHTNRW